MQKVILITGASSGFGKATAELLAQRGHIVYGTSRTTKEHPSVHFLNMDVRDRESIASGVRQIIEKEGRIDVLVNNAGMGIGGSLELATPEEIDLQMGTNFMGCVNMCQAVLPQMRKQRQGRIINLSSIGGIMGLPYQGYYSASKFAIEGFSEALSAEVRGFGISVSMVEPGDFATGFTASRKNSTLTLENEDYGDSFRRSLDLIEKEENGGLKPEVLARRIAKIVECRHPKLRYVVANLEQWFSVVVKRILPGNWFVGILRNYYKV
ncbi:MAG: SDR family oxidoreductase [Bacteroidales bacterium]|nr:SDR family oxidoreductase [Bacteroidales bacterium]